MVKVAVVLSGCGYLDGAEIHESVLTAYFLEREGAEVCYVAPDIDQMHVVNHQTGEVAEGESRNVLVESARISRGSVISAEEFDVSQVDAVVLPGGFGAAKNLSSFATEGAECTVDGNVENMLRTAHAAGQPIGAVCIAPALVGRVLGKGHPSLTVGNDSGTVEALETLGARHVDHGVEEIEVDRDQRIVSTPAYMLGPGITDVARGIEALCKEVVAMVGQIQPVEPDSVEG
ncbi:MAG: isoprenoid biosynthesis glyoxalase ElbB [Planctomycetota bacterium]|nr:isoprenoid biosynthesis glyoxalase ElbB [Planctomycetota bacterium]